jgi:hypothetical protein
MSDKITTNYHWMLCCPLQLRHLSHVAANEGLYQAATHCCPGTLLTTIDVPCQDMLLQKLYRHSVRHMLYSLHSPCWASRSHLGDLVDLQQCAHTRGSTSAVHTQHKCEIM